VRVLRSRRWFPQSPGDDHDAQGDALRLQEETTPSFSDCSLDPDDEYFYSLFALRGRRGWARSVQVHVNRGAELSDAGTPGVHDISDLTDAAERRQGTDLMERPFAVYGAGQPSTNHSPRIVVPSVVLPALVVVAVIAADTHAGWGQRITLALAFALLTVWRVSGETEQELDSFLKWLALPTGMVVVAALGKLAMAFWLIGTDPGVRFFGRLDVIWFVMKTVAFIGVWLIASLSLVQGVRDHRWWRRAMLAGPTIVAFVVPVVAVAACAVFALVLAQRIQQPDA
jgi:hypothetical protein